MLAALFIAPRSVQDRGVALVRGKAEIDPKNPSKRQLTKRTT